MEEILQERFQLSKERIEEILREDCVKEPFGDFFRRTAGFLLLCGNPVAKDASLAEKQAYNHALYEDILPEHYGKSYGNPSYAVEKLGELGLYLSFLYTEIRGMTAYAAEGRIWDMTVCQELFLEVYAVFCQEEVPKVKTVRDILYWYVNDYCEEMVGRRIRENIDPSCSFAADLIRNSDLSDVSYLYDYGEYVSENETTLASYLASFSQKEIEEMAAVYTEGYRKGFLLGRKPLEKKRTVNIRYCLGFERMVKAAIEQFEAMGLSPTIFRAATHAVNKRQHLRIGYYGAIPNKQFDYDHKGDAALFTDEDFVHRKLRAARNFYEQHKELAEQHGGPACIEIFGETPFEPEAKKEVFSLSPEQQKLSVRCDNEMSQITNRYIKGEERSFTIIAYPVPEIGKDFDEIFRQTYRLNTLDCDLYQGIQQKLIDALDEGYAVRILGAEGNETNLTVALHELSDRVRQTNFENCVADVNIPVGEVFTSPLLKGTTGTLHVSGVYLDELFYRDLKLTFEDGMITSYSCKNFAQEDKGRAYIRENVLYHHDTLPLGEFAIGTNTTAYAMSHKYGIEKLLPILIAEKMGPHFAVGDTCYSWAEDTAVYNPDGKEIIARDNEVSLLRKENPELAYKGCHTDITLPYEELDSVTVLCRGGREIPLLSGGRFVLPGTEVLNEPLEEL